MLFVSKATDLFEQDKNRSKSHRKELRISAGPRQEKVERLINSRKRKKRRLD